MNHCCDTSFATGAYPFLCLLCLALIFLLLFVLVLKRQSENERRKLEGKNIYLEKEIKDLLSKKKDKEKKEILFRIENLLKENFKKDEKKSENSD